MIKAYMHESVQSASKDNHPQIIEFKKEVHEHEATEEDAYFPAAILIGDWLKLTFLPR